MLFHTLKSFLPHIDRYVMINLFFSDFIQNLMAHSRIQFSFYEVKKVSPVLKNAEKWELVYAEMSEDDRLDIFDSLPY